MTKKNPETLENLFDNEHEQFLKWLNQGIERKWISTPVCATHEGLPLTPDEENEVEVGYDPCIVGMRLWY